MNMQGLQPYSYSSSSIAFINPGYEEEQRAEKAKKMQEAAEARTKLQEFERLADPNNEEMQEMLTEMRKHVEALERTASTSFYMEQDSAGSGGEILPVKINPRDPKGFIVP
mmetsp:Transcript_15195/g.49871  ORF Transcript_15195/g.49871 Transcript_15195/m.49871 type:complete len:111 (-) Transcript_15195:103-435(-)